MVLKDSLYMTTSLITKLLANVFVFLALARLWGVDGFGTFMYPFTLSMLLVLIIDYGFALQLVKDISKTPDNVTKLVSKALLAKIIMTIFLVVVTLSYLFIMSSYKSFNLLFLLLLLAAIIGSYSQLFNYPLRGLSLFKEETKILFSTNIVHIGIIGSIILFQGNHIMVAIGFLMSRIIYLACSVFVYERFIGRIIYSFDLLKESLNTLKENFPYAVHVSIAALYFQVDTLIVHHFTGNYGVGLYQSAIRIVIGSLVLADVFTNVYLPRLSKVSINKSSIIDLGTSMTRYMLIIGTIGSIIMILLSEFIIDLLYGIEYYPAIELLILFSIVLVIRYFGTAYGAILTISNKQNIRAIAVTIALLINVLSNVVLIPYFGLSGAVYSAIITAISLNIIYMVFTWTMLRSILFDKTNILIMVFAIIVIVVSLLLFSIDTNQQNIIIFLISSLVIFLVGLAYSDEWKRIKQLN
jgi:O-antigen/teichoic acid export membrane protein